MIIIVVVNQENTGKERKMVHFTLNTSILFEMLKGTFYNSKNWKKNKNLALKKNRVLEVWPVASAGHIHETYN